MPTESSKGEFDVVLPQEYGKHDWRGKGNCRCSSHKPDQMLLGGGFKFLFKGTKDSTTTWFQYMEHPITKQQNPPLGNHTLLAFERKKSKHVYFRHTVVCYCQHVAGHTCFIRWLGHLICHQQQNLFIITFKCGRHPASKKMQSINQSMYVGMKTSITCCI